MAPESGSNFFDQSTFTSGLIDDVDATIVAATVEEYDFNGKATHGNACCIKLSLQQDGDGEPADQYWSIGQAEHWVPTDDANSFQPVTGKAGINKNSAGAKLIGALNEKGFPKNRWSEGVKALVGYKFHWKQVSKGAGDDGKDKTVLLPSKLISAPSDKKTAGKGAAKATGAGAGSTAADASSGGNGNGGASDDVTKKAVELAVRALTEAKTPLSLDELNGKVFKLAVTDKKIDKASRKQIVDLMQDTDFLSEQQGPDTFVFDAEAGTVEAS